MIEIVEYKGALEDAWNDVVNKSRNGTFLLNRGFMDYHKERFVDCSLMFSKGNQMVGLFPANYDESSKSIYSHQGLTYGGLILTSSATTTDVMEMFELMKGHYKSKYGAENIYYKPIPHIYHRYPCEEDLYCLFRNDAELVSRSISSTIFLEEALSFSTLRQRKIRRAEQEDLDVYCSDSSLNINRFWKMLSETLESRHGVSPVHSASEMELLMKRFRHNIKLFLCDDDAGNLVAGVWMFVSEKVVHTQYLASSERGREIGALDYLIDQILEEYSEDEGYLDFGISTENGGRSLNEGLIFQKEGFGGRGVCYDTWKFKI